MFKYHLRHSSRFNYSDLLIEQKSFQFVINFMRKHNAVQWKQKANNQLAYISLNTYCNVTYIFSVITWKIEMGLYLSISICSIMIDNYNVWSVFSS